MVAYPPKSLAPGAVLPPSSAHFSKSPFVLLYCPSMNCLSCEIWPFHSQESPLLPYTACEKSCWCPSLSLNGKPAWCLGVHHAVERGLAFSDGRECKIADAPIPCGYHRVQESAFGWLPWSPGSSNVASLQLSDCACPQSIVSFDAVDRLYLFCTGFFLDCLLKSLVH